MAAWRKGGRFLHFWWATVIVSVAAEGTCYLIPSVNNFWHAQGVVSLFGRRFPLYMIFACKYVLPTAQSVNICFIINAD